MMRISSSPIKMIFLYLVKSIDMVKSKHSDHHYEIDSNKWTCTCSVGKTGFPSEVMSPVNNSMP